MFDEVAYRRALTLLADILDYPASNLAESVQECRALASGRSPEMSAQLGRFQVFIDGMSSSRIEEVYSQIFDLNAVCHPYIGYHLFGESYKRSAFLLELMERYRACGFEFNKSELADRISVILRFLAVSGDAEQNGVIISEGILPALIKMTGEAEEVVEEPEDQRTKLWDMFSEPQFKDEKQEYQPNSYQYVLLALRALLKQSVNSEPVKQGVGGSIGGGADA